jgi:hypothetical protein
MSKTTIPAGGIADSAVTTAKINADAIDGTKIADDAINSEHYTDGSIDTAHIGDDQVTADKATGIGTHTSLETINISSAVSHIDTSAFISSTYKTYLIIGRMVRPQDNSTNLRMRGIEVGGSLMNSSNYNYQEFYSLDSGTGRNYHSSASYVQLTNSISSSVDNGAFNFALYFNCDRATGSDAAMTYYWQGGGATGGDAIYSAGGGWYDGVISNDPPEKLRFYFDNGNIYRAKFTIYGITGAL